MIIGHAIRYQWRRPDGCEPGKSPVDWKSWRVFSSIPILFKTREAAQAYLDARDPFMNLRHHRKVSCSISPVYGR